VRPVPSDKTPYAVVYNIDAVEGLNLTADDVKVVWTEAAAVEKFHRHGGQCASREDRSTSSYLRTSSLARAKKPRPNAVSAKLSQMAKKGERGLQGTGKVESRPVQLKEPLCTIHKNRRERRPFLGAQKPNHLDLKTPSRANGPLETMRDVMRASSADHACNLEFGI
jgi:hypothetical protein